MVFGLLNIKDVNSVYQSVTLRHNQRISTLEFVFLKLSVMEVLIQHA